MQDRIVGNKREKGRREQGSDEFGSLPVDDRLSAMFTLTALSPPAPNPEELSARDQYPVRSAAGRQPTSLCVKGMMLRLDHSRNRKG